MGSKYAERMQNLEDFSQKILYGDTFYSPNKKLAQIQENDVLEYHRTGNGAGICNYGNYMFSQNYVIKGLTAGGVKG